MNQKFAFVAVLGASNVGKSTLVNHLVGTKVSIVSPKVQTTRSRVKGIFVQENTQLVFIDTPGIFKPNRKFDRAMVASAWEESGDSDIRLLVVDAQKGLDKNTLAVVDNLEKLNQPCVLVINKIDLVPKTQLLPLIEKLNKKIFTDVFLISALKGEQTNELLQFLLKKAKPGAWLFDGEQLTDLPDRQFASEITREKLFLFLQQEIPYSVAVETTKFQETEKAIRIEQDILVERTAQRSIVLGKNGEMIKKIGTAAREEMCRLFSKKVHLFLYVKVDEKWTENKAQYTNWGLDFNV